MNRHLFKSELDGLTHSNSLTLCAKIAFIVGVVFAVLTFLASFITGVLMVTSPRGDAGSFVLMFFVGLIGGSISFFLGYVCSVLLKAFASITLHSFISALNSENIAVSVAPRQSQK